jgi:GxxExxY protein
MGENRQDSKGAKGLFPEPSERLDDLARRVIGAAIEVHRHLGPGFLESVYEEALGIELELRSIPFVPQQSIELRYKGRPVGQGRVDLLVGGDLVVEVKAVSGILPVHRAQVISYLRSLDTPLGLLINFKEAILRDGIRRVVWTGQRSYEHQQARHIHKAYEARERFVVAGRYATIAFEAVEEDFDLVA